MLLHSIAIRSWADRQIIKQSFFFSLRDHRSHFLLEDITNNSYQRTKIEKQYKPNTQSAVVLIIFTQWITNQFFTATKIISPIHQQPSLYILVLISADLQRIMIKQWYQNKISLLQNNDSVDGLFTVKSSAVSVDSSQCEDKGNTNSPGDRHICVSLILLLSNIREDFDYKATAENRYGISIYWPNEW